MPLIARATPITLAALLLSVPLAPAHAQEAMVRVEVHAGDTLSGLSKRVLSEPKAWTEVARINQLRNPNRITPGQTLLVPQRLVRWTPVPAKLVAVTGDVRVAGVPAAVGTTVAEGQQLQTGGQASAVVELADGSRVKLPPSSLVEVINSRRYAQTGNIGAATAPADTTEDGLFSGLLRILQGSVEVFATKVLRAKPLEVSTPTAVVGVRGTEFRVSLGTDPAQSTRTGVTGGTVQVDGKAVGVSVPSGFGTVFNSETRAAPSVVALLPGPDLGTLPATLDRPDVRLALPGERRALRVQVAADADFNRIVGEQLVPAGSDIRIAGLDDGVWHVRARRIDDQGLEGLDSRAQFTLQARPEPPATQTPAPGSRQSHGAVDFRWAQSPAAASYRLQVARDASFKTPLIEQTLSAADARLSLPDDGTYHWRVAAVRPNGQSGPFGDGQSFQVVAPLGAATGGATPDGSRLQLHWDSSGAGHRYSVMLARDAAFTDVVAQADVDTANWDLPAPEQPGDYHFRYQRIEPDGYRSPPASPLKITVLPRTAPTPWWLLLAPFALGVLL